MTDRQPRTLVIAPNWVGDAVMSQPLLSLLRQQHPEQPVDVLAPAGIAPVFSAMPEVATVIPTGFKHGSLQLGLRWNMGRQLKARGYAAAYVLPNTLKFALIPWLAGIPLRVGYKGESRYGLINQMHHDQIPPRAMQAFYAALAYSPTSSAPIIFPKPHMEVTATRMAVVLEKFGQTQQPRIVFAPGAEFGAAKRWPAYRFAALAAQIIKHAPQSEIVLLGSGGDLATCQEICDLEPTLQINNLAGKTSLEEAIALIASARAVISNDSGLLHIASALNRPVIALYGPTDPNHAPPFSDVASSISLKLDCSPCRQRECPLGHGNCMHQITHDMVWEKLKTIIDQAQFVVVPA